jgi:hypothetical protein
MYKRKFSGTGSDVVVVKRHRTAKQRYGVPRSIPLAVVPRSYNRSWNRYGNRSRVTTVVRGPGPIPPRAIVKMKYVEEVVANGTTLDHLWNLNSTFDPNRTGTGHQPYGRDTYATLYNRYRVFAVGYRILINTPTVVRCTLLWNNETSNFNSNPYLAAETPKAINKTASSTNPCVFKGHLTLSNIVGQTSMQYKSDDRFQAQAGADPTESIILHTIIYNPDGSAVTASGYQMQVQLTYYVEWFDQNGLSQS